MDAQQKEVKKGWKRFWIGFDIFLFGLCVLLFLIPWDPIGVVGYLTGYFGGSIWGEFDIWILFCWPMYIFLLIAGFARIIKWQDLSINPWKVLLMRIALFLLMVLCFPLVAISIPPPFTKSFTYIMGLHKWTERRVDVEEIRDWMQKQDEKAFVEHQSVPVRQSLNKGDNQPLMPESILKLYPLFRNVDLSIDRHGKKHVNIWNGSGHGHWQVIIYMSHQGIELPASEKEGSTWLRLDDGSYVRIY